MIAEIALLLTLLTPAQAAPSGEAAKIKTAHEQAQACANATVKGDFAKLADLTHPSVLKAIGGREAMIEKTSAAMDQMKQQGMSFDPPKVDAPKTLTRSGSTLFCVAPTAITIKAPTARIKMKSFLLGVSTDDGKTWKFLDGNPGEENLRKILPEIPKDMKLPEKTKPEIERAKDEK